MEPPVTITFDCTPLRSVSRFDVPLDASPAFRKRLEQFQAAVTKHGTRNTYYLTDAACQFRFTNNPEIGWVKFVFEGTVITDDNDSQTVGSDLTICLDTETCDWLTQPAVEWLKNTVGHAVEIEFNRYIAAGDLSKAMEQAKSNFLIINFESYTAYGNEYEFVDQYELVREENIFMQRLLALNVAQNLFRST